MRYQRAYLVMRFLVFLFCLISCSNPLPVKNEVIVHVMGDPEMLNPCNSVDATTSYLTMCLFQKLIEGDFREPHGLVPVLAESRPVIDRTPEGKMKITFSLRKEAKWDNGTPVTARDVEFSIKTVLNPLVNNRHAKPSFSFINDFVFYPDDERKFSVVSNEAYFLAEATFTDIFILPEYMYDPKGLLRPFTVSQLSRGQDSQKSNPSIKEFADDFNSEKRMRDPAFISGSGPYRFSEWETNERVTFTKKENWWGDTLRHVNCFFEAYPAKLIFQTIKDQTTALVALKAGSLDVMQSIKSKDFAELPKSEKFVQNFNTHTPMEFSYVYVGVNVKRPLLTDKLTRQALAHIVNVDEIIKIVKYGEAERTIGPIHPSKKKAYGSSIPHYEYDLEKAKVLLERAGWKNTNGDATLDKVINGKREEFVLDFLVNAGNDERKSIALMIREQAKKIGITLNVLVIDWAVFLEKCNSHQFDLIVGKWLSSPYPDDLKQIFHSVSSKGGSNYSGFSNAAADALMDSIRIEIDENNLHRMYLRCQQILHDEVPMIFLYSPTEHIAIHKKFGNAYPSVMRPGYWLPGFRLTEGSPE